MLDTSRLSAYLMRRYVREDDVPSHDISTEKRSIVHLRVVVREKGIGNCKCRYLRRQRGCNVTDGNSMLDEAKWQRINVYRLCCTAARGVLNIKDSPAPPAPANAYFLDFLDVQAFHGNYVSKVFEM